MRVIRNAFLAKRYVSRYSTVFFCPAYGDEVCTWDRYYEDDDLISEPGKAERTRIVIIPLESP